jgi:hypothetical protein
VAAGDRARSAGAAVADPPVRRGDHRGSQSTTRALGPIFLEQLEGAVMGTPLPLDQSLLLAWPQTVGLVAATALLFTVGYVLFQRQEVRA